MKLLISGILRNTFQNSFQIARKLVLPCCCAYCKKLLEHEAVLCERCLDMVRPIVSCPVSLTKTKTVAVHAISDYRDPIRSLILAKRWSDIIASKQLGQLVWDLTIFKYLPADYLIPVPLHWTRFAKRGYNQAQEMGRVMAHNRGIPMIPLLRRIKKTKFQAGLTADERESNVGAAFALAVKDYQRFQGKHLVLVDDVLTTGSTIKSAARRLFELQPASITVIVAARVV